MAGGDAREDRAGKTFLAINALAGRDGRERTRGWNAQGVHSLADQIFAQYRSQGGAAVAIARERRPPAAFPLDVATLPVAIPDLAHQHRAPVAQPRHKVSELMAGIGHRDRLRAVGNSVSSEQVRRTRRLDRGDIEAQFLRQRKVEAINFGFGAFVGACRAKNLSGSLA